MERQKIKTKEKKEKTENYEALNEKEKKFNLTLYSKTVSVAMLKTLVTFLDKETLNVNWKWLIPNPLEFRNKTFITFITFLTKERKIWKMINV